MPRSRRAAGGVRADEGAPRLLAPLRAVSGRKMKAIRRIERVSKRALVRLLERVVSTEKVPPQQIISPAPRRILVVRQHHQMGDMLLATPVFRALKETFPRCWVGVVASRVNAEVLAHNPHIDRVFTYDKRNPLSHLRLLKELRSAQPDLAVVLHTVSFSLTSTLLSYFSGARFRVGSTSASFGHGLSCAFYHFELPLPSAAELEQMSESEHNLYPLSFLGVGTRDLSPLMVPGRREQRWADGFWGKGDGGIRVAVHPGAGKKENVWPPENFAWVMTKLAESLPLQPVVVCGPWDMEYVERFLAGYKGRLLQLAERSIGEVAAVLKSCRLVLCNDTGIMHVSCAVGARTIALFGPTDPARWAPVCSHIVVLRADGGDLSRLPPQMVLKKAREILRSETGAQRYP